MAWKATSGRPLNLLFDGECRFCTAGSERLARLAAPGAVRRISSRDEQQMARFPAMVRKNLGGALQLVSADGDVAQGAEAVNRVLHTRPVWRLVTWVYWVPGLRALFDWMYGMVARTRYRIAGKVRCESGACAVGPRGDSGPHAGAIR